MKVIVYILIFFIQKDLYKWDNVNDKYNNFLIKKVD